MVRDVLKKNAALISSKNSSDPPCQTALVEDYDSARCAISGILLSRVGPMSAEQNAPLQLGAHVLAASALSENAGHLHRLLVHIVFYLTIYIYISEKAKTFFVNRKIHKQKNCNTY